ncbi:transposase, IS605 OrfB family [Desulfofarcimen acetoxidans DSM 771]|uniref:Transposase, IS605 OrfB family n=1 Tax=Desulfofarcimen acetoxidans (strain ATCC 49208 / DSM 771 / KCTC 5769 / VKM B-1644 / 5575) TaxID=485916 RepID=C8W6K5_DESAS|nr:RNA-guided endonuclease TnpB family protein [Desulfofarcimen acetoxidans]ACV64114.1 transposase, IS605 OrfB family [Desulfofarcimen acetoxidans DSM 771]
MFATQKNRIKHLTKEQYALLQNLCRYAKNLYNVALYNIRQHYFVTGKLLSYAKNCALCKTNENFKMLQAGVSQQIIRVATQSFKSFLGLKRLAAKGQYPAEKVRIPRYLKKDGYFQLVLSTNAITINAGYLQLPLSNVFKKDHPEAKDIRFPFPERLDKTSIREVRINPAHKAHFFEVEYIYRDKPVVLPSLDSNRILGIDLGVDNLAACASTTGHVLLIDGKQLKAANQWYNKERARLQSIKDLHNIKSETHKLAALAVSRENFITDYLRKAAKHIVEFSISLEIGTVVVGVNKEQKQGVNIGHVNNQNFVQIPLWKFRRILKNLCDKYGITYIEVEESYTSKASFLDKDFLPEYDSANKNEYTFSGRRIKRGLYRTKNGCVIHADINGAANIIRKYRSDGDFSVLDKDIFLNPYRVQVLNTPRKKPLVVQKKKSKAAA